MDLLSLWPDCRVSASPMSSLRHQLFSWWLLSNFSDPEIRTCSSTNRSFQTDVLFETDKLSFNISGSFTSRHRVLDYTMIGPWPLYKACKQNSSSCLSQSIQDTWIVVHLDWHSSSLIAVSHCTLCGERTAREPEAVLLAFAATLAVVSLSGTFVQQILSSGCVSSNSLQATGPKDLIA